MDFFAAMSDVYHGITKVVNIIRDKAAEKYDEQASTLTKQYNKLEKKSSKELCTIGRDANTPESTKHLAAHILNERKNSNNL